MEKPGVPTVRYALDPNTKLAVESAVKFIVQDFGPVLKTIGDTLARVGRALWQGFNTACAYWDAHEKVVAAGWVPSLVIPYAALVEGLKSPTFSTDEFLTHYFKSNDAVFGEKVRQRLEANAPDHHCCEVLGQAVAAHQAGLYHCVAPTVFSEIERSIRLCLGTTGRLRSSEIKAILEEMKKAKLMALSEVGPLGLTDILTEQIYQDTRRLNKMERRFINRHVVVHGFEKSAGFKDSINALLLADNIISFLKWRKKRPGSTAAASVGPRPASKTEIDYTLPATETHERFSCGTAPAQQAVLASSTK